MKRLLTVAASIVVLSSANLVLQSATVRAADLANGHHRRHPHVAYVEYLQGYGPCRTGWWQTLRYGHVRPRWGTWCR
jgi:hypothetical protein